MPKPIRIPQPPFDLAKPVSLYRSKKDSQRESKEWVMVLVENLERQNAIKDWIILFLVMMIGSLVAVIAFT